MMINTANKDIFMGNLGQIRVIHGDQAASIDVDSLWEIINMFGLYYEITNITASHSILEVYVESGTIEFDLITEVH